MKIDHPVRAFTFLFECLMLGVGVGYNIEISTVRDIEPVQFVAAKHIHEVCDGSAAAWPDVNEREWYSNSIGLDVFVVPDSREGWVKLLRLLLSYHFPIDGNSAHPRLDHFIYNTIGIRPKGTPIKTYVNKRQPCRLLTSPQVRRNRQWPRHVGVGHTGDQPAAECVGWPPPDANAAT